MSARITVWSTRRCLSHGIERFDAIEVSGRGAHVVIDGVAKVLVDEWHRSESAAIQRANELRAEAIGKHRMKIERLEALRFESASAALDRRTAEQAELDALHVRRGRLTEQLYRLQRTRDTGSKQEIERRLRDMNGRIRALNARLHGQ